MTNEDMLQDYVEYALLHDDERRWAISDRNWLILAIILFMLIWHIADYCLKWEVALPTVRHIIFALPFGILFFKMMGKNGEAMVANENTLPRSRCVSEIDWIEKSENGCFKAYRVAGPGLNSDPELGELHLSEEQIQRFIKIMRRHKYRISF